MSTTSVRVALRVRPLNAKELLESGVRECITVVPGQSQVVIGTDRKSFLSQKTSVQSFTFDHVFDGAVSQEFVYDECARPLLDKFVQGFNACIFAYGQTGSGKTFTMGTGLETMNDCEEQGIIPRAITMLFDALTAKAVDNPEGFRYSLSVSFIELYNEEMLDLLNPRPRSATGNGLTIREDSNGNIIWGGIREEPIGSPEDFLSLLQKGSLCRTTGSTDMNAQSSRSHAICSIVLRQQTWSVKDEMPSSAVVGDELQQQQQQQQQQQPNPATHPQGTWHKVTSKFHFVDLAGSERLKRTKAEGGRKQEGISINEGLFVLGQVISALGDEGKRAMHVPYRDSKLTRLLQDSLGGNSQTLMLACVSPSITNYGESLSTLQYANRAKNIKNKVAINEEWMANPSEQELKYLRSTVSKLQSELAMIKNGGTGGLDPDIALDSRALSAKTQKYERQLQNMQSVNTSLQEELDKLRSENESISFEKQRLLYQCMWFKKRIDSIGLSSEQAKDLNERLLYTQEKLNWYQNVITRLAGGATMKLDDVMISSVAAVDAGIDDAALQEYIEKTRDEHSGTGEEISDGVNGILLKIQREMSKHEQIVDKLTQREGEYEAMRHAYEQKLLVLQEQLAQVKKERDIAIAKLRPEIISQQQHKEKAGTLQLKQRYEKENRKLEAEIKELRNRANARSTAKMQNEQLTRTLRNTIQTLKSEKNLLGKRLREEADRYRDLLNSKTRELARLKKKQEASKRLAANERYKYDRNRHDTGLQRSNSTDLSTLQGADHRSRASTSRKRTRTSSPPIQQEEEEQTVNRTEGGNIQEKWNELEAELRTCTIVKQIELQIETCEAEMQRLVQEQTELLQERERCLLIEAQNGGGEYDPSKPQYMDERLGNIGHELGMLQERIYSLRMQCSTSLSDDENPITDTEQSWRNVAQLISSFNHKDTEQLLTNVLREFIRLRVVTESQQSRIQEQDTIILDSKVQMDHLKSAAFEATMDYEKRIEQATEYSNRIVSFLGSIYQGQNSLPDTFEKFLDSAGVGHVPSFDSFMNLAGSVAGDEVSMKSVSTSGVPVGSFGGTAALSTGASATKDATITTATTTNTGFLPEINSNGTDNVATGGTGTQRQGTGQKTIRDGSSSRLRQKNLDWKSLDLLSGVNLDQEEHDVVMADFCEDQPKQTTRPLPLDIERVKNDMAHAERRKSFDKLFSLGRNALNWAKGKKRGQRHASLSVSTANSSSNGQGEEEEDEFEIRQDDPIFKPRAVSMSQSFSNLRHRAAVHEIFDQQQQLPQDKPQLMDVGEKAMAGIRKSKSIANNLASTSAATADSFLGPGASSGSSNNIFHRLAYAHTKASGSKIKPRS